MKLVVKKSHEPSRNKWYISECDKERYLRRDGTIGDTILDDNCIYGYWLTEQEAQYFLDNWLNQYG